MLLLLLVSKTFSLKQQQILIFSYGYILLFAYKKNLSVSIKSS